MVAFTTLVGQYNATPLSLTDTDFSTIALDSASRIIQDHTTSSIKIGDGTDILDVLVWDAASAGTEKGLLPFGIYKTNPTNLADTDGDFVPFQFDSNGRLRVDAEISVATGHEKAEDSVHSSGDIGSFSLAVANEAQATLVDADGDYTPFAVDTKGRLYTNTELYEQGTDADIGVDEANDGEIDVAYNASTFTEVASIAVGAGQTLYICGVDGHTDVLTAFRLSVYDDTTLDRVIRKWPVTENVGYSNHNYLRSIEVTGGATISVKLEARCMRQGKTAHVGGGINAYIK